VFTSNLRASSAVVLAVALVWLPAAGQTPADPDAAIQKLGSYVASYGEQASVIVGVEKYSQRITTETSDQARPRQLTAEFAIVKATGGWTGYRDVVEVDGKKVSDRRDRLATLFTDSSATGSEITRIANESARYNVGPVATNLNLPTTALFFFQPENLSRFAFTRAGTKKIDGIETVEFAYKEVKSPTLVRTRDGRDVPLEGKIWIVANDGTVVRTQMRLRGFSDVTSTNAQQAPSQRPAVNPNAPTGGKEALANAAASDTFGQREIKSVADFEVTYKRDAESGLWLPSEMMEVYEGPIKLGTKPPFQGMSTTRARYSDFKRFGTGARVTIPKAP
jgi:hypothetical protein